MSHRPRPAVRRPRTTGPHSNRPVEALEHRRLLATYTFDNFTAMNTFDDAPPPTPAFNYPVPLTVSGLTGQVSEIRVTLYDVYHGRPADLDILVVSPARKSVLVMSDAGGTSAIAAETPIDLTFTDSATRNLPQSAINAGVYRPTNYDNSDFFPGNDVPFDAPSDTSLMALAADDPNGTWLIFVVDDTRGSIGGVAGGWGMTFVTGGPGPAAPSTPDMHPASDRGDFDDDNITNNNTPVFRGTAAAGTQVRLFIDGVPDATGPINASRNWQIPLNAALTDGTHFISARAIDAQGTEGPASPELTVRIDTVVPDVPSTPDLTPESDTGPSNIDNDTTDATPTFTGTADGADFVTLLANTQVVGRGPVIAGTYTVTPTDPMAPGTYDFTAVAEDIAGNATTQFNTLQVIIRPGGTVTPRVTQVFARGSTWAPPDGAGGALTFMEYLEAQGIGDDAWGYRLAAGTEMPWINVNQLLLRYDAALTAAPVGILVDGARSDYVPAVSLLDSQTALLTLPRALGVLDTGGENGDRIRLTVPGAGAGGAAYTLDFLILQGDVDRSGSVLANDYSGVKARFFKNTTSAVTGTNDYTPFHDVDGNGSILANDYSAVKSRFFDTLPPAAASSATFGVRRIADQVL